MSFIGLKVISKLLILFFSGGYLAVELPFASTCVDFKYLIAVSNFISAHVTFQEKQHWGSINHFETTCNHVSTSGASRVGGCVTSKSPGQHVEQGSKIFSVLKWNVALQGREEGPRNQRYISKGSERNPSQASNNVWR